MPTFKFKDGFGFDATITPSPGAMSKYFQNLPDITMAVINLNAIQDMDLTNPALKEVQAGLTFSQPIQIGKPLQLTVGASGSGALSIFVPAKDGAPLFDPDLYGDPILVPAAERYVSLALSATLNASAADSPGNLKFGFNTKATVTFSYYNPFVAGTTVGTALAKTMANFVIPGDLDDIAAMPAGSIATAEGTGDLKFSGSVNLLSVTNPLASASIPAEGKITVSAGGAISVGADYDHSTDYQVRIQRLAGGSFKMGFYRKRNSQFDLTADANIGISAKLGDNDVFAALLKKISSNPDDDLKALQALPEEQSKAIQTALKSAIDRSLEIGASLELSRTGESDAMFLYQVDLNALQDDGRALLLSALQGDLSGLTRTDIRPPAGIQVLKTLVSSAKTFQNTFKLNLLGIYNVLSLSELLIKGTTAWDATTGDFVLTDEVAADRIQIDTSNLQVKDSAKLRKVLAEHFLITAGYRAVSNVVSAAPDLQALQTFVDLEQNPGRTRMRDYALMPVALGLQNEDAAKKNLPLGIDDFGETLAYAEAGYNNEAFRALFFNGANLQDPQIYFNAGREAIQGLVAVGDPDDFRLKMATDPTLFNTLRAIGNTGGPEFAEACVAAGIPKDMVPVVGTDFTNVVWLAGALRTAAEKLQAVDQFLQLNPGITRDNPDFQHLRQQLARSLGDVAGKATADFGGPWGFEAMARLGKASSKKWLVVNRYITSSLAA